MRRLFAPFMTLMILAMPFAAILTPFAAYAKPTLLVREEITISASDNPDVQTKELIDRAMEKVSQHPCAMKVDIQGKLNYVQNPDGSLTAVLEMWSDDCD